MSPSTPSSTASGSDPLLGLVVGLYVALLVTPLVILVVERTLTTAAGPLYGTALVTLTVVTAAGWRLADRQRPVLVNLGGTPLRWLLVVPAVGLGVLGFALLGAVGAIGLLAFFFGLFAALAAFVVGVMVRTRYADAVTEDATEYADWRAGWPDPARRRLTVVAGGVVGLAILAFLAGLVTDDGWLRTLGQVALPFGVVVLTLGQERDYVATDVGIEQRLPVARRLYPWAAFDGYARTEDAIVLTRPRRVALRFAVADLEDPDAVEAACARFLPER